MKYTRQDLLDQLKSKNKTKTFKLISDLPRDFNDTLPKNIAIGISKMKGLNNRLTNNAKKITGKRMIENQTCKECTNCICNKRPVSHEG